jgi:Fe2+ transport system protein FeoA
MKIDNSLVGQVFRVSDVFKGVPCDECNSCVRVRLMEMGILEGEKVRIVGKTHGLWRIDVLSEKETTLSSLALRDEEIERVCVL